MHRVLITGERGFIGSYLRGSLNQKYETIGLPRSEGYDITAYDTIVKLEPKIDMIVHAAAIATDDFESSFQTNVVGTLNVCKLAQAKKVEHLVLISSLSAFETQDNEYFNNYAKTKKMSEEVAVSYCADHDIKLTILRLAQVYDDAGLAKAAQPMLYYFINTIQDKGEIALFGRTNPLRNYIHVEYVCDVISEILQAQKVGTWNLLDERSHTISEVAYMIFGLLGKTPNMRYLQDKPNIPSVHIPREDRYHSASLDSIPLEAGIKRILAYEP
jgi:nucleoside-diphosphate-sugar epimerase